MVSIAIFKLMNGEEIIAKVNDMGIDGYLLEDPVQIYRNVAPNGMTWIQCSHWLLFSTSSLVEIERDKILAIINDPNKHVIKNYEDFISGAWEEHHQQMEEHMIIGNIL